jgi:hypothetical protein
LECLSSSSITQVSHGLGVKIKADEQKRGFTILLIFKMILLLSRSCIILSMATDRSPFFYSTTISTTNISFLFYYNKNPQSRNCHAEMPDNGHTRNFFIMKFYFVGISSFDAVPPKKKNSNRITISASLTIALGGVFLHEKNKTDGNGRDKIYM